MFGAMRTALGAMRAAFRAMRAAAPPSTAFGVSLAFALSALMLAGCGGGGATAIRAPKGTLSGSSPAALALQRTDLAIAVHGLLQVQPSIRPEIAATRAAWPAVAHGLPVYVSPATRRAIAVAALRSKQIATPRYISFAGQLTGAAAAIAGLELSYEELALRGWTFTRAAADYGALAASGRASLAAAGFLRVNAALYIGCIYDAHHNLSVICEDVKQAYTQLGGARVFGATLRPALVEAVAHFYSPAMASLTPALSSSSLES
jgi:hypothetical protein